MEHQRNKTGFTLVEMIIVMMIVAVLVSLSAAKYFRMVEKSRGSEATEVLTRMFRGHKIMDIDELINLDLTDQDRYRYSPQNRTVLRDGREWDPGFGSADWEWGMLGFDGNFNDPSLDFAYDFLPRGINAQQAGCNREYSSFLPDNDHNIAIARRKDRAGNPGCVGYIYIYLHNGTIVKSSHY